MAAASVLTREKDFEEFIGMGKTFEAPDRAYIRMADDMTSPRTTFSVQELEDYALRVQQRRRFWEDLGNAADVAGVPVSMQAYNQAAHRTTPETTDLVSTDHDEEALAEGERREVAQNMRNAAH